MDSVECEAVMIAADKRFAVHEGSPPFMYGMHRRFSARQWMTAANSHCMRNMVEADMLPL
jgi:hypothetical protein